LSGSWDPEKPDEGTEVSVAPAPGAAGDQPAPEAKPDRRMLEALVCPQTRAPLRYDSGRGELVSKAAGLAYPIRGGIPIMLADEARRLDD
jgi:uncharacterized protein YbaR (Trm112 family)